MTILMRMLYQYHFPGWHPIMLWSDALKMAVFTCTGPSWLSAGLFLYTNWGEISLKLPPVYYNQHWLITVIESVSVVFSKVLTTDTQQLSTKLKLGFINSLWGAICAILPLSHCEKWYMKHHSQFSSTPPPPPPPPKKKKKKKKNWRPGNIHSFVANIVH